MEQFKVRAKSAVNCGWVYGYPVPFDGVSGWAVVGQNFLLPGCDGIGTEEYAEVLNDTICRYTGLTDYLNEPIFEGDILSGPALGIVRYGNHPPHISHTDPTAVGFYIEWQGEDGGMYRTDVGYWLNRGESCTVRGNIFDNPDLIKGGQNEQRSID